MEAIINQLKEKLKELLFITEGKLDTSNKQEKSLLLIHAYHLVKGLECIGLTEEDNDTDQLLPETWNVIDEGVYSFKYRTQKNKQVFIFKFVFDGEFVNVNSAQLNETSKLYSTTINLNDINFEVLENNKSIFQSYDKDILNSVLSQQSKQENNQPNSSLQVGQSYLQGFHPVGQYNPSFGDPLRGYGRGDLQPNFGNPFANIGGGNSGNPFINPSGRNQGPRFDPIGPNGFNGIPDDIQPDFFPTNNQGPHRGGRGPIGGPFGGGMGGGFSGGFGGGFGGGFV